MIFTVAVTTVFGQTIKLTGNRNVLGNWNTDKAISLSADQYTSDNPVWHVKVTLMPGQIIQYKYIKVESSGEVTWEGDPNHTYEVPASCGLPATVNDKWQ